MKYSATASNTVFVSSCASSRCRKFKIVVSSGIGSRPSSRLQNARIDWISYSASSAPDQTDRTTAAGSRCATSRRSETLDGRLEDPPSDNAARSLLPALTTAPPPPSPLETRRALCASSCPHSLASRSSAARPDAVPLELKAQCAMIRRLIRGSLIKPRLEANAVRVRGARANQRLTVNATTDFARGAWRALSLLLRWSY